MLETRTETRMRTVTGGQGCLVRGEVDWSAEMDTWTMSGDRRRGEITDPSNTGGNRNNSALNFHFMFALNMFTVQLLLNKMVKFKCIYLYQEEIPLKHSRLTLRSILIA